MKDKYEIHLGNIKEKESNYLYCIESVVDLLNSYEIERTQLRARIEELESDFAGYENFDRERRLEKITEAAETENGVLRETIRKIKWEFSQCYGMENPESFQNRRIRVLISELEERLGNEKK